MEEQFVTRRGFMALCIGGFNMDSSFVKTDLATRLIIRHEGWRDMPYRDTKGNWTIGYGTKLPISKEEGSLLMSVRLRDAVHDASHIVKNFGTLDEVRRAVLIDMAYALGHSGFKSFKDMIKAVVSERWADASYEIGNSVWAGVVGPHRIKMLQRMMLTGGCPAI